MLEFLVLSKSLDDSTAESRTIAGALAATAGMPITAGRQQQKGRQEQQGHQK